MTEQYLDFERPIQEIVGRIQDLKNAHEQGDKVAEKDVLAEIERLEVKQAQVTRQLYRNLDAWQKVQIARHPQRPQPRDYIQKLMTDFQPLAGDRQFADDSAMIAGLARFSGMPVAVLGIDKGKTTKEKMANNFGMPRPEGYRKAKRIMEMANRFKLPIMTFVDTPGAYPGVDAEARGQSEAIAACIETLLRAEVPVVSLITGEGGSGGALALAVADQVCMMEHSIYSVISPEGCASILWREATKQTVPEAAQALSLTAQDLEKHKLIDRVIKEPVGAAHRSPELVIEKVNEELQDALAACVLDEGKTYIQRRREKFIALTR